MVAHSNQRSVRLKTFQVELWFLSEQSTLSGRFGSPPWLISIQICSKGSSLRQGMPKHPVVLKNIWTNKKGYSCCQSNFSFNRAKYAFRSVPYGSTKYAFKSVPYASKVINYFGISYNCFGNKTTTKQTPYIYKERVVGFFF